MPVSKNAKRNQRRRQMKRQMKQQMKETCGICETPFCKLCPDCNRSKVPAEEWREFGCKCKAPKICIACAIEHVKGTAKKHCLEINCTDKTAKCPWCRVDMDITCIYDNTEIVEIREIG